MTPVCLGQSQGDIITLSFAANCTAAKMYKSFMQQWTIQAYWTLTNSDHVMAQGTDICQQRLSLQEWSMAAQESLMPVHWNPWYVFIPMQWTHLLHQVLWLLVGWIFIIRLTLIPAIHLVISETGRNYEENSNYNATNISAHQEPCQCAFISYCHECCVGKLWITCCEYSKHGNAGVPLPTAAQMRGITVAFSSWHDTHCDSYITQPIYGKVGGGQTKGNKLFFVSQGAVMVRLTHKVSQYYVVFAITPSTPQNVKCSQYVM